MPSCFSQRKEIITGSYEPNDEECEWPSDEEDDEEAGEEKPPKQKIPEPETPTKGMLCN